MEAELAQPQTVADERTGVWIVIPAFNEATAIGEVVAELTGESWSVLVVDDGSADDTADVARKAGAVVISHATNRGQGAALQTGFEFAQRESARIVVTLDADGQHCAADVPALIVATNSKVDIALGSRFLGSVEGASRRRRLFLRFATWISNRLVGIRLTDAHCGIRAIQARVLGDLRISQDGMSHASQILRKIAEKKLSFVEVPVTVRYSEYSRAKGQSSFNAVRILFDYFFQSHEVTDDHAHCFPGAPGHAHVLRLRSAPPAAIQPNGDGGGRLCCRAVHHLARVERHNRDRPRRWDRR